MADQLPQLPPMLVKATSAVRPLISHLATEGKQLEEQECVDALNLVAKIQTGTFTPEEEAQFWKSYSGLIKEALPARVEAIYLSDNVDTNAADLSNPDIQKIVRRDSALRRIRKYSIGAFIVSLTFLAYLSVSEGVIQRNQSLDDEYQNLSAGITRGTMVEGLAKKIRETSGESGASVLPTVKVGSGSISLEGGAQPPAQDGNSLVQPAPLRFAIEARKRQLESLINFNNNTLRILQLRWMGIVQNETQLTPLDASVLSSQQSINSLISKYLLPVAAALLGVTVFILRTASENLETLSFRSYESGLYSNRLALGVIGGIAISWFAVTDTTGIVGSITPAALAFLVGYSVEVLYNVLDSLVKALGAAERRG